MKKYLLIVLAVMLFGCGGEKKVTSMIVLQKDVVPPHNEVYTERDFVYTYQGMMNIPVSKSRWISNTTYNLILEITYSDGSQVETPYTVSQEIFEKYDVGDKYVDEQ